MAKIAQHDVIYPNIAIDGPAGAGKSTIARMLARRMDYRYLDSGAMYRALTLKALRLQVPLLADNLAQLARETVISLETAIDGSLAVILDGQDVTEAVRQPEVSASVSQVAMVPAVRERMVMLQRWMARAGGVVMDGRDIGSRVFPDTPFKFFLTASLEERARRRQLELAARGYHQSLALVMQEVEARDTLDSNRSLDPLVRQPDAVLVDTTGIHPELVVDQIVELIQQQIGRNNR